MENIYIDLRNESEVIKKQFEKDLVSIDDLLAKLEEMAFDIERIEEEKEDLEKDIKDNYRRIPVEEQYEISDRDFI